jgi:hypothetical protein
MPSSGGGKNATVKVKGCGLYLRFTTVAAACSSTRSPEFDAGQKPRARRYLFSREWAQNFATFFSEATCFGPRLRA